MSQPDVIIVGGGIGGLAAAFSLARENVTVRVLERSSALGEVGAGLQLAPNCTRILADYGLIDEAVALGVVPETMAMRDALNGELLTSLDLRDLNRRYGFPYLVMHRSDLHAMFFGACERLGVEVVTGVHVVDYATTTETASVTHADGTVETAPLIIAADGIRSQARRLIEDDEPISSAYVAYRGTVPADHPRAQSIDMSQVVVYVGPRCHFVHYGLRGGAMLNQVYVFESPKAIAGVSDWGTPDELDQAFTHTTPFVREGLPFIWRDKWWRMFDRNPIASWVINRVALLGDSAHAPLQYIAQGAIMAIEDGWVLGQHVRRNRAADGSINWDAALTAYNAVRPEHCRRVVSSSRKWGELWHLDGNDRERRNSTLRERDTYDYRFVDWLYSPTALEPGEEPPMYVSLPLGVQSKSPRRGVIA